MVARLVVLMIRYCFRRTIAAAPVHWRLAPFLLAASITLMGTGRVGAHVFISEQFRAGGNPPYDGSGWVAEVFLAIPEESAGNLLQAEAYVGEECQCEPDFTFRTDWIDFPAGPVAVDLDANFATMGDFLNDYIYDVSDPSKLDEPFGNFLIRFGGFLSVRFEDDVISGLGLPIWVDFGTIGYDGYRLVVGETIYRFPRVLFSNGEPIFFWRENPICEAAGAYRIEFTYFNQYDTDPEPDPEGQSFHSEYAGVELYTWHGSALALPAGQNMIHPERGPGSIIPPRVIYQASDLEDVAKGDIDADLDIDAADTRWHQTCFSGPGDEVFIILGPGCRAFDMDGDNDVDLTDYQAYFQLLAP